MVMGLYIFDRGGGTDAEPTRERLAHTIKVVLSDYHLVTAGYPCEANKTVGAGGFK
jgi:hypothetical protein